MAKHNSNIAFSKSIGTRLLRVGFSIYFVVTLIITATQMYSEYEHTKESVLAELVHLEVTFKDGFADAVWAFDRHGLDVMLSGLSKIESVAGIKIENLEGEPLSVTGSYETKDDPSTKVPLAAPVGVTTKSHFFKISYSHKGLFSSLFEYRFELWLQPKSAGDEPRQVGIGSFYSSQRQFYNKVKHGFMLILINSVLKTAALWVIFRCFLMVIKPLWGFSEAILEIEPSQPKKSPVIEKMASREDEIGFLARSFLEMIGAVSANISTIKDLNTNLEKKVAERTALLAEKTKDISSMLANLKQGIFTFGESFLVGGEYSAYLENIFETKDISGHRYSDLLFKSSTLPTNEIAQAEMAVDSILGYPTFAFDINKHLLPKEIVEKKQETKSQILELDWDPITGETGNIQKILVCIRDVTRFRELQTEAEKHQIELDMIDQILAMGVQKTLSLIKEFKEYLSINRELLKKGTKSEAIINEMFRNIHTVKGNALTYNFRYAVDKMHLVEQFYAELKQDPSLWDYERMFSDLDLIDKQLEEYKTIISTKLKVQEIIKDDSKLIDELEQVLTQLPDAPKAEHLINTVNKIKGIAKNLKYASLNEILGDQLKSLQDLARIYRNPHLVWNWTSMECLQKDRDRLFKRHDGPPS